LHAVGIIRTAGETIMRPLIAVTFVVLSLAFGLAASACSNDGVGSDYYENDVHHGYPGPGTETPNEQ
jgi:hypothetical protein